MNTLRTEHEQSRRNVWAQALQEGMKIWNLMLCNYSVTYHIEYADIVLAAYDKKFPEPISTTTIGE